MKQLIVILLFLSACAGQQVTIARVENSKSSDVLRSALALIDIEKYDVKTIKTDTTLFHLIGRKRHGLGLKLLETSLQKMWPRFKNYFKSHAKEVAIIDFDAPFGGGPLAPFVLGIYFSENIGDPHQELVRASTGWAKQKTTAKYIENHYRFFSNPTEAYVDDILVHELGHIPFGWGLTRVNQKNADSFWFSFGMGLLYDRLAWNDVYNQPSPLFEGIIATWSNNFSKRKDVDQRLVNPDTSKDAALGMQRLQTYGHGKAFKYLEHLRQKIGAARFDELMNEFVAAGGEASYDRFTVKFSKVEKEKLIKTEDKFSVR